MSDYASRMQNYRKAMELQKQIETVHLQQIAASREGVSGLDRFRELGRERKQLEAQYHDALARM